MNDHAVDAMIYAWMVMKEKEATRMVEYINLGKVEAITKTHVLAASDSAKPYVTIDFVPDGSVIPKQLTDNISEILKHPDDYVLCNTGSITKAHEEMLKLRDRVRELEEQLSDAKKESEKKLCEVYTETAETFYKSADKLMSIDKIVTELKKERDYWKDRFGSVVMDVSKVLENNGVEFTFRSIDGNKWNAVIDIPELNEAKKKVADLERKLNEKVNGLEAKWSAMFLALKEKGVDVLYIGEEDGKPNIDVNIPEIDDLKKELEDLKSKTVAEARYEFKPECLTMIFTMCDGSEQVFAIDSSEAIDATVISCGTVQKCKSCKNHRYYGKICGHMCYLPDSKCIAPNTFNIFPLTDEEAEGPACDKFEARKE